MKTEKQIMLLSEEVGKSLYREVGSYDSIKINRKTFDKISQTMRESCNQGYQEYNWIPILLQGVFIQSEDEVSPYKDYLIFSCVEPEISSENKIVLKLASFQKKIYESEEKFLWNYSCTAHLYLVDEKGERNLSISVGDYRDGKSQILIKQKRFNQSREYVKTILPSVLENKMQNFMTFILTMGYLNHISEHPEMKIIEQKQKSRRDSSNMRSQEKYQAAKHIEQEKGEKPSKSKTVVINGIKIVTTNRKVSAGLRSCKPHRFTHVWSVRGHYRHYKSGRVVYIKPYEKGAGKRQKKHFILQ